jgi:hypothetical protein
VTRPGPSWLARAMDRTRRRIVAMNHFLARFVTIADARSGGNA